MPKKIIKHELDDGPSKATVSSGNVFADMGGADLDELLAKAELVSEIIALIRQRGLTQAEAAKVLGLHQPEISLLERGRLSAFSLERLFRCLGILNVTVEVRLSKNPPSARVSPLRVMTEGGGSRSSIG